MTIDWRAAAELPARELEDLLLDEADRIMAGLSDEDEDRMLVSLAEPLRAIWLLNWLDFEVCQGSLLAYFFNRHGRHATLATEVLRKLGASRMADVVAAAERSHRPAEAEWTARRHELSELGEYAVVQPYAGLASAHELGDLTDRYWEAAKLDNWGNKLEAYLHEQVLLVAGA